MSVDLMNACMRSFELAMTRETYLGSIKREIEVQKAAWDDEPDIVDYDCPDEDCPCKSSHLSSKNDKLHACNNIHWSSRLDEDCSCHKIHLYSIPSLDDHDTSSNTLQNSQENSIAKRSPSITSFTSYNWRQDLSSSEILEHNLESFDFLLSRLLPSDSPDFPTRIIPHLDPGCPRCHTWQAHPLPKYEQYYHDMRDFSALLSARQIEWTELSHEIAGHDDWFCAFEMSRGLRELDSKLMDITFETKWPEHGDGKGDEGLGVLFREAHERVKNGTWRLSANREMGWEDLEDL
ncbi:MAG: hypothetical protein L6R42_003134 [Xanthoria sp. 1 TBL-2021]|nr:MAG: hypothetical protein L6R42_003134 [Xanthoria sp. 1 TBL-2021]